MSFQKCALILILIGIFNHFGFSQKKDSVVFGNVTKENLLRTSYPVDTTAAAIVLFEKATTEFKYDFKLGYYFETSHIIRKKILKPSGLDESNIILYNYKYEDYSLFTSFNIKANNFWWENGEIQKTSINPEDIFETEINQKLKSFQVTIPQVKVGSIIEYTYKTKKLFKYENFPDTWFFQGNLPCLHSEYEINVPDLFYYQMFLTGHLLLKNRTVEKSKLYFLKDKFDCKSTIYNFKMENIPAFYPEPFLKSETEFISKVGFNLAKSGIYNISNERIFLKWEDLNDFLYKSDYFMGMFKFDGYLNGLKYEFRGKNNLKNLNEIFYYFKNNFSNSERNNTIYCEDLRKVFKNSKGTPNEINLLLVEFLLKKHYEAKPLLISSRKKGRFISSSTKLENFDYVLCRVELDGESYILDVNDKLNPFGLIPFNCLNSTGFEINSGEGRFLDIKPVHKHSFQQTTFIDIDKDKFIGKLKIDGSGYFSMEQRKKYEAKSDLKNIISNINLNGNYEISNLESQNLFEVNNSDSTVIQFNFIKKDDLNNDDLIYLDLFQFQALNQNPFLNNERKYPIDFGYLFDHKYNISFKIPNNYTASYLPSEIMLEIQDKSVFYNFKIIYNEMSNLITLESLFKTTKPIFDIGSYLQIKELFAQMINKQSEKIILKRKL